MVRMLRNLFANLVGFVILPAITGLFLLVAAGHTFFLIDATASKSFSRGTPKEVVMAHLGVPERVMRVTDDISGVQEVLVYEELSPEISIYLDGEGRMVAATAGGLPSVLQVPFLWNPPVELLFRHFELVFLVLVAITLLLGAPLPRRKQQALGLISLGFVCTELWGIFWSLYPFSKWSIPVGFFLLGVGAFALGLGVILVISSWLSKGNEPKTQAIDAR